MVALRRFLSVAAPLGVILALACAGLAQDTASDQAKDLLKKGIAQYKALDFKAAKETLVPVDRTKLSDDDQKALDECLTKVDGAIRQQAAAKEAFDSAEAALKKGDLVKAREGYTTAAGSEYFQPEMRKLAKTQLAAVEDRVKLQAAGNAAPPATEATAPKATPAPVQIADAEPTAPAPKTEPKVEPKPQPRHTALPPVVQDSGILTRALRAKQLARQEADLEFQKNMRESADSMAGADSASAFDAAADAARVAKETLETNKNYYTTEEYRLKMARVDEQFGYIEQERKKWEGLKATQRVQEIAQSVKQHDIETREKRRQEVDRLTHEAKLLIKQQEIGKAIEVMGQIKAIDPTNSWVEENEDSFRELDLLRTRAKNDKTYRYQEQRVSNDLFESEIPWYGHILWPEGWRQLTIDREKYAVTAAASSESDRATLSKLKQRLPKLDFDETDFNLVVPYLRDISGANIDVNWQALQAAGIEKTAKVTVHLTDVTVEKALRVVLANAGGTTPLSFVVDEGVITISTKDDLSSKTISRVYDISDLLVRTPNFVGPVLDLASSMSTSSGNNSSGGSNGGGIFGNTSNTNTSGNCDSNNPTKEEVTQKIIATLKAAVEPTTWAPDGTPGTITELNGQLVVKHTADAQAELSNVISQLRESRSIQIAIEARFITISSGFLESIGLDLDFYFNLGSRLGSTTTTDPFTGATVPQTTGTSGWGTSPPGSNRVTPIPVTQGSTTFTNMLGGSTGIAKSVTNPSMTVSGIFLDDIQVDFLLQATQANETTRTLTAPHITISNGQRAYVTVGTQQAYVSQFTPVVSDNVSALQPTVGWIPTGSVLDVEGTVSADRRYVTLTIRPQVSTLNSLTTFNLGGNNSTGGANGTLGSLQLPNVTIQKLETTVQIPDGGTLLLGGQKLVTQDEREQGVPLLSKIPIINRAFTNRGMTRDEQTLLILVKPKILITKELEEKAYPPE